jgi:hypothetical protein
MMQPADRLETICRDLSRKSSNETTDVLLIQNALNALCDDDPLLYNTACLLALLKIVIHLDSLTKEQPVLPSFPNLLIETWTKYLAILKKFSRLVSNHDEHNIVLDSGLCKVMTEATTLLITYIREGILALLMSSIYEEVIFLAKVKLLFFFAQRLSASIALTGMCMSKDCKDKALFILSGYRGLSSCIVTEARSQCESYCLKGEDLLLKTVATLSTASFFPMLTYIDTAQSYFSTSADRHILITGLCGLASMCCVYMEKMCPMSIEDCDTATSALTVLSRSLHCISTTGIGIADDSFHFNTLKRAIVGVKTLAFTSPTARSRYMVNNYCTPI